MMDGYGKFGQPHTTEEATEQSFGCGGGGGKGLAKGNLPEHEASRTQSRSGGPSALERVRQAALGIGNSGSRRSITMSTRVDLLREAYFSLKRNALLG